MLLIFLIRTGTTWGASSEGGFIGAGKLTVPVLICLKVFETTITNPVFVNSII